MAFATNVVPENLQWLGVAKEATAGTAVAPALSIPFEKIGPDNKPTMLVDKGIRGSLAEDYGDIQGVEIADFPLSGNVHLDAIGHLLLNEWGDYTATGTAGTGSTTLTAQCSAGATTATVASITGFSSGQAVQLGVTGDGNPEIVILSTAPSGSTLTFTNTPARFTHANGKAVAGMVAPFAHVFSLLNSGNGQPVTHTLTHHDQLAATNFARQYAYWCCSGMDFKMNSEQLFQHDSKGTAVLGVIPGAPPTNTQSGIVAIPNWEFKVGIGGPASGGTLVNNIEDATISQVRALKPKFTLQGAQNPFVIARLGLGVTGKFTFMAQDESPLLALLANTQQQLQIAMTQGAGASQLGITFNHQLAAYEVATIQAPDTLIYDVSWRALANTTDAGQSGGFSPSKITLTNAVPTY